MKDEDRVLLQEVAAALEQAIDCMYATCSFSADQARAMYAAVKPKLDARLRAIEAGPDEKNLGVGEPASPSGRADCASRLTAWAPIETAPKDGTTILVWPRDDEHATAYWDNGRWRVRCCGQSGAPSLWMPLPPQAEPPTPKREAQDEQADTH